MQAASWTFPSRGRTKGVDCLQRNIWTGIGTTSSLFGSSSDISFSCSILSLNLIYVGICCKTSYRGKQEIGRNYIHNDISIAINRDFNRRVEIWRHFWLQKFYIFSTLPIETYYYPNSRYIFGHSIKMYLCLYTYRKITTCKPKNNN